MRPRNDDTWIPLCKRKKLSLIWILGICGNQLSSNLIWTPIALLTKPYCQKLNLNIVATTFIMMIGTIVGMIIPPFIAVWSDTTTLKWGRRRIWMICGELLAFTGLMLVSFCQDITRNHNLAIGLFVIGQIATSVGGNTFNGPGRAMCSDVTPQTQQVLVGNICQVYNGLAGVISNLMGALKLYHYTHMMNEAFVLLISCVFGFAFLLISILVTPEEPLLNKPDVMNPFKLLSQSFKFLSKDLIFLGLAFMLFQFGVNQAAVQATNFMGRQVFHGIPDQGTAYDDGVSFCMTLALVQTVLQVIFSFLNTPLSAKIGLKWTWILGMLSGMIADVLFFWVFNKWVYIASYITLAFSITVGNSIPYTIISLVAKPEQLAGVMSVMILFSNLGGFLNHFAFTMGLGSISKFKENTGPLIGYSCIPLLIALALGVIAIKVDPRKDSPPIVQPNPGQSENDDVYSQILPYT